VSRDIALMRKFTAERGLFGPIPVYRELGMTAAGALAWRVAELGGGSTCYGLVSSLAGEAMPRKCLGFLRNDPSGSVNLVHYLAANASGAK
jgi:hypothetical protein